jgi:hypothetical protein
VEPELEQFLIRTCEVAGVPIYVEDPAILRAIVDLMPPTEE